MEHAQLQNLGVKIEFSQRRGDPEVVGSRFRQTLSLPLWTGLSTNFYAGGSGPWADRSIKTHVTTKVYSTDFSTVLYANGP